MNKLVSFLNKVEDFICDHKIVQFLLVFVIILLALCVFGAIMVGAAYLIVNKIISPLWLIVFIIILIAAMMAHLLVST